MTHRERRAIAMREAESLRAANRPRMIPWADENPEEREKWIGLALAVAASDTLHGIKMAYMTEEEKANARMPSLLKKKDSEAPKDAKT